MSENQQSKEKQTFQIFGLLVTNCNNSDYYVQRNNKFENFNKELETIKKITVDIQKRTGKKLTSRCEKHIS